MYVSTSYLPVSTVRAYENIVAQIEDSILRGVLNVGDQLPGERDLAGQFAVSRVVTREAIRHLEARGIIEVRRGSGTYIRSVPGSSLPTVPDLPKRLSAAPISDLHAVQQALSTMAAPLICRSVDPKTVAALRDCCTKILHGVEQGMGTVEDIRAQAARSLKFHRVLAHASENVALVALMDVILPLVATAQLEVLTRDGGFDVLATRLGSHAFYAEHVDILNAVVDRDPWAVQHRIDFHLQQWWHTAE